MAIFRFSLVRGRRKRRRDLIQFMEALSVFLFCGFDLSFSWPETLKTFGAESDSDLAQWLTPGPAGITHDLNRLGRTYPEVSHRLWFSVLSELYQSGAGISEAVVAIAQNLRREQERELDVHGRTLPTRINVILILCFLPPTLASLFIPLLLELQRNFSP